MRVTHVLFAASLLVPACKDDKGKETKTETKAEVKPDEGEPTLQVDQGEIAVEGPVPPETSMVFYVVDGALLPLACYDKDKRATAAGDACLDMIESGAEVRVSALDSAFNKVVGDKSVPQCMTGTGKKTAWAVEGITEGAAFKFAAWPPSALKVVQPVLDETTAPQNTQLDDDEKSKLLAAAQAAWSGAKGELAAHQIAEVDVDGDASKDKFYAVYIPHPTEVEQYLWSGAFLAAGGDLEKLTLLESSKKRGDAFHIKGTLDLDGDGSRELWMRLVFDGGAGDRIVTLKDGRPRPLGKWSCEAI